MQEKICDNNGVAILQIKRFDAHDKKAKVCKYFSENIYNRKCRIGNRDDIKSH